MSASEAWKPKNPSAAAKVAVRTRATRAAGAALLALTIAALAPGSAVAGEHKDPTGDVPSPLDLAGLAFTQSGPQAVVTIRTAKAVAAGDLPTAAKGNLCLTFSYGTKVLPRRRYCVVRVGRTAKTEVNVDRLDGATGKILARSVQRISTHAGTRFVLRFDPQAAGLPVGIVHLGLRSNWRVGAACADDACADTIPAGGTVPQRIYRAVAAGCTPSSGQVTNGARRGNEVAITFDDGPSTYTPSYLASLRAEHAVATFFQIGQQVPGQGAIERAILATGSAIGDHSWSHPDLSRGGAFASSQLSRTKSAIETAAGGYVPCLFRPPYGATSSALLSVGGSLGMKSVLWDVDTNDWQLPGTSAIVSRAVGGAHAGSIVLMHDGGGNRSQTAAAVRPVIRGLRAKGLKLVTVPQLLGLKTRWKLSRS